MTHGTTGNGERQAASADFPSVSVIIPAFNEAAYLPETLARLRAAEAHFVAHADGVVQVLVVDNASTDGTSEVASKAGATVVREATRNIARVRNAGAAMAAHDVLVFVDADTLVPPELLFRIAGEMKDDACAGGCVDFVHQPKSVVLRAYFGLWRAIGLAFGTAQGACQFCRKALFEELGGYDETWYMGEDVDFYWRLKRLARRRGLRCVFIRDLQVAPSPRRWEAWSTWRILVWTNPFVGFALRRRKDAWGAWYREPPR